MTDPRIDRIRAELEREGWDAIVLTNTHDVVYATGYSSIMEYWTLQEPICAAIVARDPSIPVTLVMPEANIALLAVAAAAGEPDRAEELRLTELLTFCRWRARPTRTRSRAAAPQGYGDLRGARPRQDTPEPRRGPHRCTDRPRARARRVAFDDLRVWLWVQKDARFASYAPIDGVDAMVRARSVKTPSEAGGRAPHWTQGRRCHPVRGIATAGRAHGTDLTLSVAGFMAANGITPVDEGTMLFGGAYDGEFIPELFRTRYDRPFEHGQIVILETSARPGASGSTSTALP